MINLRNKRDLSRSNQTPSRYKRHYLYYSPINITERITKDFLNNLIAKIDFSIGRGKDLFDQIKAFIDTFSYF